MATQQTPPTATHRNRVVAAYCATFLKPEMRHIYRQIVALKNYRSVVIARRVENAARFPFAPIVHLPKPWSHELRRFWAVAGMERMCADVAHIYFGNIGVQLLPFFRLNALPSIVSFHGADVRVDMDRPAARQLMREALDCATLVLARSRSLQERIVEMGCSLEKTRIHRTGIPLEEIPFRTRAVPVNGRWLIVQACRLIEKKGLPTSLRAFAIFKQAYPHARFVIAGEGPMLEPLKILSAELGIRDNVDFTGFLDQSALHEQFYRAHIFVHPSEIGRDGNQEGVPNSMLEAMASGLPVVSTRHGGIPEAIEDGVSGILCGERDSDGIAHALRRLAENDILRSALAEAAARAVREQFDSSKQIEILEACYDEAIARYNDAGFTK
jgi:colanic acid/amylovoran biosynthesis glycosyltransferase